MSQLNNHQIQSLKRYLRPINSIINCKKKKQHVSGYALALAHKHPHRRASCSRAPSRASTLTPTQWLSPRATSVLWLAVKAPPDPWSFWLSESDGSSSLSSELCVAVRATLSSDQTVSSLLVPLSWPPLHHTWAEPKGAVTHLLQSFFCSVLFFFFF